jgi:hypothetical protein
MLNILMFVSETPNKSLPFGFAATKRQLRSVTTIGSREPTSKSPKSFSLARSASCSLRGLSAAVHPSLVSVLCACRSNTITCCDTIKNWDLCLVISITRLSAIRRPKTRNRPHLRFSSSLAHALMQLGDSLVAVETPTPESDVTSKCWLSLTSIGKTKAKSRPRSWTTHTASIR